MQARNNIFRNIKKRNCSRNPAVPFLCILSVIIKIVFVICIMAGLCGCGKDSTELISVDSERKENSTGEYTGEGSNYGADGENVLKSAEQGDAVAGNSTGVQHDGAGKSSSESGSNTGDDSAGETSVYSSGDLYQMCFVHVCGAVNAPGVYELGNDKRIVDAITTAGGFSSNANIDYINLAEPIMDGMKIYVPAMDEELPEGSVTIGVSTAGINASGASSAGSGISDASGRVSAGTADSSQGQSLVNINTADAETLMTLPGIGQSKAAKIIDYREKNGAFKNIGDIMNVDGIKNGMYDKIKDRICTN